MHRFKNTLYLGTFEQVLPDLSGCLLQSVKSPTLQLPLLPGISQNLSMAPSLLLSRSSVSFHAPSPLPLKWCFVAPPLHSLIHCPIRGTVTLDLIEHRRGRPLPHKYHAGFFLTGDRREQGKRRIPPLMNPNDRRELLLPASATG